MVDRASPLPLSSAFAFPPPIVVINTAHSGSRLLARMLMDAGVYMGANLSDSLDCLEMLPLVEHAVLASRTGVPAGPELDDPQSRRLAERHFDKHLAHIGGSRRWGWKLCETLLIVPLSIVMLYWLSKRNQDPVSTPVPSGRPRHARA